MKRLTDKNYIEEYEVNFEKNSDKNWSIAESDTHIKVTGEPIEKLGELEDVLEKWHIEDLDKFIEEQIAKKRELNDILWKMIQELSKLKQKVIVPKFEVDQTLFRIDSGSIVPFLVNDIYGHIKADETISIQYFDYDGLIIEENELFSTKEEAEQKLAEIKGEKDE